ncbi:hypothetical protein XMM383_002164 [Marinobacterium sp. xm-m-383]|nr:hypothetical protein [Marinobacterium sp. xm-m-383]
MFRPALMSQTDKGHRGQSITLRSFQCWVCGYSKVIAKPDDIHVFPKKKTGFKTGLLISIVITDQ